MGRGQENQGTRHREAALGGEHIRRAAFKKSVNSVNALKLGGGRRQASGAGEKRKTFILIKVWYIYPETRWEKGKGDEGVGGKEAQNFRQAVN